MTLVASLRKLSVIPGTGNRLSRNLQKGITSMNFLRVGMIIGLWLIGSITGGSLAAQESTSKDSLAAYGGEGPAMAMNEVATAFSATASVKVVTGPPEKWLTTAGTDADIVFSSAEFMMTQFINEKALGIDPTKIIPLYSRPSAILVRTDNPKHIQDFPDLLNSGVRVMVVNGAGQTGLWEDMAGRNSDVHTVRKLRNNIVVYASSNVEAIETWRKNKDVDAWITWNIWHTPLRDEAKLVTVSKPYRIFRQCSVALTARGREKPKAAQFIQFLQSPKGAQIFESWGWINPGTDTCQLNVRSDIAVVVSFDRKSAGDDPDQGLSRVLKLIAEYETMGVPRQELHISVVVSEGAEPWLLNNEAYRRVTKANQDNPNITLVKKLQDLGVSIEICGMSMKSQGCSKDDLLPHVRIVPGVYQRIIDLELQGYAYLKF